METTEFDCGRIFDEIFDQVVILDRKLKIRNANRSLMANYGLSLEGLLGRQCYEIFKGLDHPCPTTHDACPLVEAFKRQTPVFSEQIYQDEKGNPVYVELKAIPFPGAAGQEDLAALVLRDITQWKRTENKLVEAFGKLQRIAEMGNNAILVLGSSRSSRISAGAIQTVGKVPLRNKVAKPRASNLSVLFTLPIITFALAACAIRGLQPAVSISSTIQYQFPILSSATAVPSGNSLSNSWITPA